MASLNTHVRHVVNNAVIDVLTPSVQLPNQRLDVNVTDRRGTAAVCNSRYTHHLRGANPCNHARDNLLRLPEAVCIQP